MCSQLCNVVSDGYATYSVILDHLSKSDTMLRVKGWLSFGWRVAGEKQRKQADTGSSLVLQPVEISVAADGWSPVPAALQLLTHGVRQLQDRAPRNLRRRSSPESTPCTNEKEVGDCSGVTGPRRQCVDVLMKTQDTAVLGWWGSSLGEGGSNSRFTVYLTDAQG